MNIYSFMSMGYDFLDKIWLSDKGKNPRNVIDNIIKNKKCVILDMCCGTFANGLPIAMKNSNNKVLGLDRSTSMLKEARKKVKNAKIDNVKFVCRDATKTGLKSGSFDYIIIGLVLHECNEELWRKIMGEAHRLLKRDGKLIVLEWEKQNKISRKMKFAPLYVAEIIANPKYFKKFYYCNKLNFFVNYRFKMTRKYECNYTAVMELEKL